MKLNNKRTLLIGFAFFSICAFWQLYDFVVPLILRDTFHVGDDWSGLVMAADNVLAIFMLPLFGRLSDKCMTRIGKRMPFILAGTTGAVIFMMLLPIADKTEQFGLFVAALAATLFCMGTYRSPAVALMPDLTPKPLRSKANALINLMGAVGGVAILILTQFLVFENAEGKTEFIYLFAACAAIMVAAVVLLFFKVKENDIRATLPPEEEEPGTATPAGKLAKPVKISLILILVSVFFWFMGYNAVSSAYSRYYTRMWGDAGAAAMCLTIASAGAIVSYVPAGMLASKFGRKKVILCGVALLAACFAVSATVVNWHWWVYILFVLIGMAWATINVNSYPMVVEISRGGDIGKYTGYYYSFSMAAQILTPILSGVLLEHVGYHTLFPYAAGMALVAGITMMFVRHGDSKPAAAKSALEHFDND